LPTHRVNPGGLHPPSSPESTPPLDPEPPLLESEPPSDVEPDSAPLLDPELPPDPELLAVVASLTPLEPELVPDPEAGGAAASCPTASLLAVLAMEPPHPPTTATSAPSPKTTGRLHAPTLRS
jgi:hypothetical protein